MYNTNLNRFLESLFNDVPVYTNSLVKSSNREESYEINQTKDGAYLFFDAPGFNKKNLKVEMDEGELVIEGERKYKLNDQEMTKTISKKFKIGESYDAKNIEATIEDGLLTVYVPNYKKQERKKISLL